MAIGPGPARRTVLATGLATLAGSLLLPRRSWAAVPANRRFEVFRKGDSIGFHEVTFEPAGDGFVARTHIELAVKVAFVTAYRYQQRSVDRWEGGVLAAIDSQTNDDGKDTWVKAARQGDRLVGEGSRGPIDQPVGIMTDLSWWNMGIMQLKWVLDAQNGGLNPLQVQGPNADSITISGRPMSTQRFRVEMGTKHNGQNWYDDQGLWVKTQFRTKREELEYQLVT